MIKLYIFFIIYLIIACANDVGRCYYFFMDNVEVLCACGKRHVSKDLVVEENKYEKLLDFLFEKKFTRIRIFASKVTQTGSLYKNFITELQAIGIEIIEKSINISFAEVIKAEDIEYVGEEYVIVFGDYKEVDVVKYYAKSIGLNMSVVLTGIFFDFTFSKYARLYDGISYCFYQTIAPDYVVFFDENISEPERVYLKSYIGFKCIAYFENILQTKMNDKEMCLEINPKLLHVQKNLSKVQTARGVLFACVFLGRAMSFFGETKSFFGAEEKVASMLEVRVRKPFLECYLIASELVIEVYKTALESELFVLGLDLNKRIDRIKRGLGLSAIKCMSFVKKIKPIDELSKRSRLIHALKFMLLDLIDGKTLNIAANIRKEFLLEALYLAPEFSGKYYFLNFLRDLGYLENLIK